MDEKDPEQDVAYWLNKSKNTEHWEKNYKVLTDETLFEKAKYYLERPD